MPDIQLQNLQPNMIFRHKRTNTLWKLHKNTRHFWLESNVGIRAGMSIEKLNEEYELVDQNIC